MKTVELITFKGCQSTVDFRDSLESLVADQGLDLEVELNIVPSPAESESSGLYGSPTIVIDGQDFQSARRGPAGFY
jgi:hypothetical protein